MPLQFAGNRFVALDIEPIQDVHPVPVHDLHSRSIHGVNPDNVDLGRVKPRLSQDVPPQADNVSEAGVTESATSTMENMVNDLTHPEPAQRAGFRSMAPDQPLTPTLKTPTASSFSDRVLPHLQGSSFTARDLVQQIHQGPTSPFVAPDAVGSRPNLPSIYNSPFAPLPGETPGSSPRPSTVTFPTPFTTNSQAQFRLNLAQQEQQLQDRSSPAELLQATLSSHYSETPAHLKIWGPRLEQSPLSSSPFAGQSFSPSIHGEIISRQSPQRASFGAIGESRPRSSGAPTSGQAG